MKVQFIDVGRNKANWEADCEKIDYEFLYKQMKKHGVLSRGIDFEEVGTGVGIIYAGFRPIGRFKFAEVDNG